MNTILTSIAASTLLAALATAQPAPHYAVTDLGPTGNPFSQAAAVNDFGLVTGFDTAPGGYSHAVLWYQGSVKDIGNPGLGGPNSGAGGANIFGSVMGGAETSLKDPNNENFCGYGTGLQCLAFLWQFGVMTPLTTLGGTNAGYGAINDLGEVAGYAEKSNKDPDCPGKVAVNGTGPQLLYFEAVIWGPRPGEIRELPPLPGDTVGIGLGLNDAGQAVGISGTCANTVLPGGTGGAHAVIWESDGSVHDLGSFGGTANPAVLAAGNAAEAINNLGQVTGGSVLPESKSAACLGVPPGSPDPSCFPFHPFLWTREKGLQDLGLLPEDFVGSGLGINNRGEVVGASISTPGLAMGSPRAFLWRNGVMSDLNALVPDSPLYLLTAFGINDFGQIAGFGVVTSGAGAGEIHAFLATPSSGEFSGANSPMVLPEDVRNLLQQRLPLGRSRLMGPR
jgi:probable HAF family extracellular repeat protein